VDDRLARNKRTVTAFYDLMFKGLEAWRSKTRAPLQQSGRPTPFASMLMTPTPGLGGSMPAAGSRNAAGRSTKATRWSITSDCCGSWARRPVRPYPTMQPAGRGGPEFRPSASLLPARQWRR
jgi:hypothetical protein